MDFDEKKDFRDLLEQVQKSPQQIVVAIERTVVCNNLSKTTRIEVDSRDLPEIIETHEAADGQADG